MNTWKEISLSSIVQINARSYSPKEDYKHVHYLDTGNITENTIDEIIYIDLEKEKLPSRARRKTQYNSILYSTVRPNQRHYGIIKKEMPKDFLVSTGFAVIDAIPTIISADYLYYYLSQNDVVESLQSIAEQSVSTYPSITAKDIGALRIKLPPLETQTAIATILRSFDDKIELNSRINENLEQQAQSLYSETFIEKANPSWRLGKLSDLISVRYGKDHKKLADGIFPVYGSGGIMRFVERPIYEKESVLIPRKGTLNNVLYVNEPFWSVDTMFYTEMKLPNVAKYVFHFVKSKDLLALNVGSAVPSMTTDILNAMELLIPDAEALQQFENVVSPMYRTMQQKTKESNKLSILRDTLLPKLMSGELDVSNIDL